MNNEKILKKKIQQYLLMPLALTVLLVGMVIVLYVHDKKSGAIAAAAVNEDDLILIRQLRNRL